MIKEVPIVKLKEMGYETEIMVVDNGSTDKTNHIARKKGARVIVESRRGKGAALKTGFNNISDDSDYVVMLDADSTYKPKEIPRMIEPLENAKTFLKQQGL